MARGLDDGGCFYRYRLTGHGPAGKGRKVSKGINSRGGEVKSVFEGTVNRELGFARRFQSRRKGQERAKDRQAPPPTLTTSPKVLEDIQRQTPAQTVTDRQTETHIHKIYIQRSTCRNI